MGSNGPEEAEDLPPGIEIPANEEGPVFGAPWQARAFGTVVALHRLNGDDFDWSDFQARLIEEVERDRGRDPVDLEETYYDQWLRAAERLLCEAGVLDAAEIEARAAAFATGERNAQEFIEGVHQEGHGHAHGRGHAH